jgi:hypothetical protein
LVDTLQTFLVIPFNENPFSKTLKNKTHELYNLWFQSLGDFQSLGYFDVMGLSIKIKILNAKYIIFKL